MHLLNTTRTAYFFDFRAVSYIFVVCSNGVEQSRFWCRADFSSRWISSRWPFSHFTTGYDWCTFLTSAKTKIEVLRSYKWIRTRSFWKSSLKLIYQKGIKFWDILSKFFKTLFQVFIQFASRQSETTIDKTHDLETPV